MTRWALVLTLAPACSNAAPVAPAPHRATATQAPMELETAPTPAPLGADRPGGSLVERTLPSNCQAPLVAIEEVSRFLVTAATHATASAACVDGPGLRVSIDEILVCPARAKPPGRRFSAEYRVTRFREGDTRSCAPNCEGFDPQRSEHRLEFHFAPTAGAFVLEPPPSVPGLPAGATPATAAHDGNCYGTSPAFVPGPISLR